MNKTAAEALACISTLRGTLTPPAADAASFVVPPIVALAAEQTGDGLSIGRAARTPSDFAAMIEAAVAAWRRYASNTARHAKRVAGP
jgi:hypothetical protein